MIPDRFTIRRYSKIAAIYAIALYLLAETLERTNAQAREHADGALTAHNYEEHQ